jgi:hypothetical protein
MANTFYCHLRVRRPFDLGLDDNHRLRVAFNLDACKHPSDTFAEELLSLLVAAGVGILGTNLFLSSVVTLPTGDGPYLSVIETPGREADYIHNVKYPAYDYPSAQIVARAKTRGPAFVMANAAYNALKGVVNQTVTF